MIELEIIQRLEVAKCGSRELDCRMAYHLGWRFNGLRGFDGDDAAALDDEDWAILNDMGGHWHQPGGEFCQVGVSFSPLIWPAPPKWTTSIDATVLMAEEMILEWSVRANHERGNYGSCWNNSEDDHVIGWANTGALAMSIAYLKAGKLNEETPNVD